MEGTIVCASTHTPTAHELANCPHIQLTSQHPWDPYKVRFPHPKLTLEEMMANRRQLSSIQNSLHANDQEVSTSHNDDDTIFDIDRIHRHICSMVSFSPIGTTPETKSSSTDTPLTSTFQSSDRHSDVSPESLSERWGISINTASKTLKKTTQRFLRSAILPLARRYRADRVFSRKTLTGDWSTDTMDGRFKSLEGNRYAQVFANKGYFSRIYPMDSKKKAGEALRLFCQEFGVPERLTFDGSKEQCMKGTEFMKQVRRHDIQYHICTSNNIENFFDFKNTHIPVSKYFSLKGLRRASAKSSLIYEHF